MRTYQIITIAMLLVLVSSCSNKKQWEQAVNERDAIIIDLRKQITELQQNISTCQQTVKTLSIQFESQASSKILLIEDDENTGKALVKRHFLIQGKFTKDVINQELLQLYNNARDIKGWKHHSATTMIALFAYKTESHFNSRSGQWSAMLSWSEGQSSPEIQFNESEFIVLESQNQEKFGVSVEQRMKIYKEFYAELWEKADSESDDWSKIQSIAMKYGLSQDQAEELLIEGTRSNWPE